MNWWQYAPTLRDLCFDLRLFDADVFDPGHPVFDAIDRCLPGMCKDDAHYIENVIGYYREQLDVRELEFEPVLRNQAQV